VRNTFKKNFHYWFIKTIKAFSVNPYVLTAISKLCVSCDQYVGFNGFDGRSNGLLLAKLKHGGTEKSVVFNNNAAF
jgi:hypothetical protein